MAGPSISTVIPAYRAARTISRALNSVLGQTRPPDEVVVVDDGSPDDLAAVLEPYGKRVTLVRKSNGGAASARNFGIERSSGDLVAFLDADDFWEPSKLEKQRKIFLRHPDVGVVAGRFYEQVPGKTRTPAAWHQTGILDRVLKPVAEQAFETATLLWTGTVTVRRRALGEQRFVPGLEPAEDRDLWVRLVESTPVYVMSEPLVTAVLEPGSLSRSDTDLDYGNMLRVVHRHGHLLGRRGVREWEARVFRKWAAVHLANKRPGAALGRACRRLKRQPWSPEGWWVLLKSTTLACLGC